MLASTVLWLDFGRRRNGGVGHVFDSRISGIGFVFWIIAQSAAIYALNNLLYLVLYVRQSIVEAVFSTLVGLLLKRIIPLRFDDFRQTAPIASIAFSSAVLRIYLSAPEHGQSTRGGAATPQLSHVSEIEVDDLALREEGPDTSVEPSSSVPV